MRPMLDDLELPQVQEIATLERRAVAEHKPPGMSGSLLQNLGRRPLRVTVWGVASGPDARQFVEKLDEKYRAGQPLPFTGDIVADARLDQVVIDDVRVQDLAGKSERIAYALTLREHLEPTEPENLSAVDASVLEDALGLVNDLTAGFEIVEQLAAVSSQLAAFSSQLTADS